MSLQRFACPHLSHPYLTCSTSRLLTMTFTTPAFDRSSSWRFEAFPYRTAPKGPPSSLGQHGALAPSLHKTAPPLFALSFVGGPHPPPASRGPQNLAQNKTNPTANRPARNAS